ncbi:MAG TPA: DinB family protein [Bryobacteraceae bacterium]|jgi:uncharacterized damage-inducible protein DinB
MTAKQTIQLALTMSDGAVFSAIEKISDQPTAFPTPNGGCHPLWVVGHLAMVESIIPHVLYGETPQIPDWQSLFGQDTQPVADAAAYPPFAEVKAKYRELRERNLKLLDSLSDADLDRPSKNPPAGREREFATFGSSFLTLSVHQLLHRGNVTDSLRAIGRASM